MSTKRHLIPVITKQRLALFLALALLLCSAIAGAAPTLDEQLMKAATCGDVTRSSSVLDGGASVNARDNDGAQTSLILAARNVHVDVVKLLLDKGADVNAKDKNGWTALTAAARLESGDVERLLLEKGLAGRAWNKDNGTAFMRAVWKRRSEVLQLLKVHGAKANLTVAADTGVTREKFGGFFRRALMSMKRPRMD